MNAGPPVVPARITLALDARGLHGPDVDPRVGTWDGNPAGDVDDWETGAATPTPEQVQQLAALCALPLEFFYTPMPEGWQHDVMYVCGHSGPNGGGRRVCHRLPATPENPGHTDRQNTLF